MNRPSFFEQTNRFYEIRSPASEPSQTASNKVSVMTNVVDMKYRMGAASSSGWVLASLDEICIPACAAVPCSIKVHGRGA